MSVTAATAAYDAFYSSLPKKPYCSDDLSCGLMIRSTKHAIKKRYIQQNTPSHVKWLVFDIDHEFNWARDSGVTGLPVPAWIAWNRNNNHAHVAYGLKTPVCRTDAARLKPLSFLAAVESEYCERLQADRGYVGLVTKNPAHDAWKVWMPSSADTGIYDLSYLASCVTLRRIRVANDEAYGLGRNVALFDDLRFWAYRAIRQDWPTFDRWFEACLNRAEGINAQFMQLLPQSEIRATAKSVAKWTHKRFTAIAFQDFINRTHTPDQQARRGMKGGLRSGEARRHQSSEKRAEAHVLANKGSSQRAIATALGVSQSTVSRWVKR